MRPLPAALALTLLAVSACDDLPLEPLPGGEVEIEVAMPHQRLRGDEAGLFRMERLMILLDEPALAGDGACSGCGGPSWQARAPLEVESSETVPWARFTDAVGARTLDTGLREADQAHGDLSAGTSLLLEGYYFGEPIVLILPMDFDLVFDLPAEVTADEGVRARLILDPEQWLYDAEAEETVRLEDLTPPNPDAAEVQRVIELMRQSIRLETVR